MKVDARVISCNHIQETLMRIEELKDKIVSVEDLEGYLVGIEELEGYTEVLALLELFEDSEGIVAIPCYVEDIRLTVIH